MKKMNHDYETIDEYINLFPLEIQEKLKQLRILIKVNSPLANERISYRMPTFYLNGNLLHFAAYSNHIGFYPTPSAIKVFEGELKRYKYSKGAIQFPIDLPLPTNLIKKMVKFRVKEMNTKIKREAEGTLQ